MNEHLSPQERRLYRRTDEILHYLWDPIGVADIPQARDEYHAYLPQIFQLVLQKRPASEIAQHLLNLEESYMGLTPNPEKAFAVAELLLKTRRAILEEGF